MKIQHDFIANACRIEVWAKYNRFSDQERQELIVLLDKFASVKPTNIFKFTKTLKAFEDRFVKYNGDHAKLEEAIKQIRDNAYMTISKQVPGIKLIKTGDTNEL